jgi:hypothetical protein
VSIAEFQAVPYFVAFRTAKFGKPKHQGFADTHPATMNGHRILIADTYYDGFLNEWEAAIAAAPESHATNCLKRTYEDLHRDLMSRHFCVGDAYTAGFRDLGWQAHTLVLNARSLQEAWAAENSFAPNPNQKWHADIFIEQVRRFRPDVLFMQEFSIAADAILAEIRPHVGIIVGQIACSIPPNRSFSHHDLIVSSWKPIVDHFRDNHRPSEFVRLGFNDDALKSIPQADRNRNVTFVGGVGPVHADRVRLLEHVCREINIDIFGYGADSLPAEAPIHASHRGQAWGLDALNILAQSKITLNRHGDITINGAARNQFANNVRLYEATGAGALLLTDQKSDLFEIFGADREVVTYDSPDDCVQKIRYLLEHDAERRAIANAGRQRTLKDHTIRNRCKELEAVFEANRPNTIQATLDLDPRSIHAAYERDSDEGGLGVRTLRS